MKKTEEAERLLRHIRIIARWWADQPNRTALEIAQGTAFSILVLLDGGSVGSGPFAVRPLGQTGQEGKDIGGTLHEQFYQSERKEL